MKALIDLDIVAYRNAATAKEEEPITWLLRSLNKSMESILEATNADSYVGYLSGADNFRKRVAKTKVYKGQRPEKKPSKLYYAREHLIEYWNARVKHFVEADDMLAIEQTKVKPESTIICSIDKDLLQVEGWHYNFVKNEFVYMDKESADRFFWKQVLTGDSTDNIQGIPGIGDKKANKLLDETANNYQTAVYLAYEEYVDKQREKNNLSREESEVAEEAERLMNETYDLVYILRHEEEAEDRAGQMREIMGAEAQKKEQEDV